MVPETKFQICPELVLDVQKKIPQEEVESATAVVSHEEDIVWTQLLLGSVYGMGQVGVIMFSVGFKKIPARFLGFSPSRVQSSATLALPSFPLPLPLPSSLGPSWPALLPLG